MAGSDPAVPLISGYRQSQKCMTAKWHIIIPRLNQDNTHKIMHCEKPFTELLNGAIPLALAKSNHATQIWFSIISFTKLHRVWPEIACSPCLQVGCGDVLQPWAICDDPHSPPQTSLCYNTKFMSMQRSWQMGNFYVPLLHPCLYFFVHCIWYVRFQVFLELCKVTADKNPTCPDFSVA